MKKSLILELPFIGPYASQPMIGALKAHAVAGLERHIDGTHTRVISLPDGPVVASVLWRDDHVVVATDQIADTAALSAMVHRWLDLDADHSVIDPFFAADDTLAPLVSARPGLRVLGSVDGFETAMLTILGQQVSLGVARTFGGRFVSAFGTPLGDGFIGFPSPSTVAGLSPEDIREAVGLTGARSRTVHALAISAMNGLDLQWDANPARFRAELLALPGIGPWTVDYLTVRILGDRDSFVADDLVLKRALGVGSGKEAAELSEKWRPWRAYALFHLWTKEAFL